MLAAQKLSKILGVTKACKVLGVSRMTEHRVRRPITLKTEKTPHPRALSEGEQQTVLATLNNDDFVDWSPAAVHAMLLERGRYLCSISTMYRLLRKNSAVRERRQIRRHVAYEAPQLLAQAPNQVWSWDITKLLGYKKFEYFHLYVMLDIFSRRVVG